MICKKCGQELAELVNVCPICKTVQIEEAILVQENTIKSEYPYSPRSKVLAGLLQIFFGGFGIGRLYLGYRAIAFAQLFTMPIFFIGNIWGIIDGILILCGQVPYDVNGIPLQ